MKHLAGRVVIAALLVAPATAWPAELLAYSIGIGLAASSQGSSDGSQSSAANAAQNARRNRVAEPESKQGEDGMRCGSDDDCAGRCVANLCTSQAPTPQCSTDEQCSADLMCSGGYCVLRPAPPAPACASDAECPARQTCSSGRCAYPPPPAACTTDAQCPSDQVCTNGTCAAPPPPAILERGTELLLRDRVAQLRQDLVLGEGPVLAVLASSRGVSPRALGRTLRAHRAELDALVGDPKDPDWAARFLRRVDALAVPGA